MLTPTITPGMHLRQLLERGERIFSVHPQVAHYFPAAAIENARKRIRRAIDRGDGPGLIVGGPGTGKSLLLQAIAAQYHERFDIVLLACAKICTRRALLQTILFELGLPYQQRDEGQLRLSLLDHLLSTEQGPAGLLMLVDEAQSLSVMLLEELRVMTNLVHGGVPRVRLVLAGSSALEESFAHSELESFSQRLSARCYLSPFSREETTQFVRAQLAAAGAAPEKVFAADTWDAVFDATDGVPRLINQLCDRALLMAEAENRPLIDRKVIQAAWADLQQLPTPWEASSAAATTTKSASQTVEFGSLSETSAAIPEVALVEPTELDDDDANRVDDSAAFATNQPVEAERSTCAISERTKRATRALHNAAGPFAEEFDEEEIVLDSFAAWDEVFLNGTPRVQNQRDRDLSTLVQAAVEAHLTTEQGPSPDDCEYEELDDDAGDIELVDFDEDVATPDASLSDWPRLRLADISDSPTPDAAAIFPVPISPTSTAHTCSEFHFDGEGPILIVEDDASGTISPGPPVRRLAYRHLFSRLRSG